jgi:hypothetical protein
MTRVVVAVVLFICSAWVSAQPVALQVGTTGLGAEVGFGLSDYFGTRASYGVGSFAYTITETESGLRYDARAKPSVGLLILDLHPFRGVFRLSAGLSYNGTRIEGTGDTSSGTIILNGVTYNTSDLGTVEGEVHFQKFAPYVGFGWGTAAMGSKGFFFTSDFGAMYSPATGSATATCAPFLAPPVCASLQNDFRAEADAFRRDVETNKFYPVVRLGLGYRF